MEAISKNIASAMSQEKENANNILSRRIKEDANYNNTGTYYHDSDFPDVSGIELDLD